MQRDSRETRKWKRSKKILSLMCIVFLCLRRRSKRMSEIHCLQPNEYTANQEREKRREKRRQKRREGEKDFSLTNQFKPVDAKEKKERRILTHLCTSRQFPSPLTASRREKRETHLSFLSFSLPSSSSCKKNLLLLLSNCTLFPPSLQSVLLLVTSQYSSRYTLLILFPLFSSDSRRNREKEAGSLVFLHVFKVQAFGLEEEKLVSK